jgi:1-acyl-sn-glycerol-3-phosphate acyltransferase
MSSRTRYTSPLHAGARFVAQRGLLKPLVWRLVTVTVLGEEHLRGLNRPFVVVSNHASHLDAPLILGSLPRKVARYVAAGAARRLLLRRLVAQGPHLVVLQCVPGRPHWTPRPPRPGHQPAR